MSLAWWSDRTIPPENSFPKNGRRRIRVIRVGDLPRHRNYAEDLLGFDGVLEVVARSLDSVGAIESIARLPTPESVFTFSFPQIQQHPNTKEKQ